MESLPKSQIIFPEMEKSTLKYIWNLKGPHIAKQSRKREQIWCPTFLNFKIQQKRASLVAQSVKNLPPKPEAPVQFLGQKDPLEKEMATHSSVLAWKIAWAEEPGRLQFMGSQRVGHDWTTEHKHWGRWHRPKNDRISQRGRGIIFPVLGATHRFPSGYATVSSRPWLGGEGAAPGPGVARVFLQFQFCYLQCLNLKQIFRY